MPDHVKGYVLATEGAFNPCRITQGTVEDVTTVLGAKKVYHFTYKAVDGATYDHTLWCSPDSPSLDARIKQAKAERNARGFKDPLYPDVAVEKCD